MTLFTLISLASIVGQLGSDAAQVPLTDPVVQVGLYGYRADGTLSGSAYDTDPSLESMVWASGSLCQMGAGHKELPAMAAHAWRFSGKVVSMSRDEAVVLVEWQRVFDAGKAATAPNGSVQLTLKPGDRVPLDTVVPSASLCAVTSVSFEARYAPRMVGTWVRATSVGARSGTASGSGIGAGSGGVAASGGVGVGGGGGRGVGAGGGTAVSGRATGEGLLDAELWLVHNAPGAVEHVSHQALRTSPEGALFAFAPMTIQTSRGALVVQVSGSFAVTTSASGAPQLVFVTSRRVTSAQGDQGSRDVVSESGGSRTTHALPAPGEVLSFEMPPLRLAGWPAVPDKFAVRLRITR